MLHNMRPMIRDLMGDLLYGLGLTQPGKRAKFHPFSIVTFHRVLPREKIEEYPVDGIAVTPNELKWFIEFFKKNYDCNTLAHNYSRWRKGENTERPMLSITFDDGQLDNFLYARPLLNAAKVPATFFVVSDGIDNDETLWYDRIAFAMLSLSDKDPEKLQALLSRFGLKFSGTSKEIAIAVIEHAKTIRTDERMNWIQQLEEEAGGKMRPSWDGMMDWNQLRQLINDGHEIGCHSKSHPILPLCDDVELEEEILMSRTLIEEKLNEQIRSFCFPNGDSDERSRHLLKRVGYEQAVTTHWGQNKKGASPFELRRFDIQGRTAKSRKGELSHSRLAWRLSALFPEIM